MSNDFIDKNLIMMSSSSLCKRKYLSLSGLVLMLLWILLAAFYFNISKINSDDINTALQGLDIIHGNYILRGWTLPPDTYYLMETHLYAILLLFGFSIITAAHLLPAIIYASLVVSVIFISKNIIPFERVGILIICAIIFLVPTTFLA